MNLWTIIKGLLIQNDSDRTKELSVEVDSASTTGTRTTLKSTQTANRTLTLPDATDTLVGKNTTDILTNKTMDFSSGGTNTLTADAVDVIYDNATSGLTATDTQAAIDEVEGRVDTVETGLSNHLSDTTDAHDASAISNVPSGNLAATDVQGALNELQSDIDTRATTTDLNNHINDVSDAHDASAISNVPSGNLTATDVQAALNELQSDIDGIGTFANQALSNLITTDINQDFTFNTGANATIKTVDGASAISRNITVSSGATTGNFASGNTFLFTGNTDNAALSGSISILSGSNSTGTGGTGALTIRSGSQTSATGTGSTGAVTLSTGAKTSSTGSTGALTLSTGANSNTTSGSSGNVTIQSGQTTSTGSSGNVFLQSGNAASGTSINSGTANVSTGNVLGTATGNSGNIVIDTGLNSSSGTGKTGDVLISSANKTGGIGNSGSISLTIGTATGMQGEFKFLKSGLPSANGDVWTAYGTAGEGYWATPATELVNDTSPQLGGDLDVNNFAIEGVSSPVLLAGQNTVRRAKQASKTNFIEEEYIHSISLLASQTNTVISDLTFAHATYSAVEITYYLKDLASDYRLGTIRVVTNGSTVTLNDTYTENISNGITFDAVINGANIEIRYTTGANTATLRADIKRFLT